MIAVALVAATLAQVAVAGPDCRWGVDHRDPRCGRPDFRYDNHNRYDRPHPNAEWRDGTGWVLPALLIGGLIAIEANREANRPSIIVEQPMPTPTYTPPTYPVAPYGYKYVNAIDPACNCYKIVLVPLN